MDVKRLIMIIQTFKKQFFSQLKDIYPETEVQSFFNLLIEFKLNLSRIDLALNTNLEFNEDAINYFQNALDKLKKHTPIQYIIGETEFYNLTFKVNNNVLIPRPETEELVDWIIKDTSQSKNIKILDIGTGSGCIAVSLAKKRPNAEVFAIDVSPRALKMAKENARINKVSVNFIETNILNLDKLSYEFDIIVSNPPYVRDLEKEMMQQNVLANEPHLALFVKDDNPLIFYNKIADLAKHHLNFEGKLYFEINQYLGKDTKELLRLKGFKNIEIKKDIFSVDRMLKCTI
jgi:release factor glutamine methyltransferase